MMYERPRVNVKDERGSIFTLHVTFHTLPLFYLHEFIRENNATVEIRPNTYNSHVQFIFKFFTT